MIMWTCLCEALELNQDENCLVVICIGLSFSFCLLDSASDSSIGYVAAASRSAAKKISSEISFVAYVPAYSGSYLDRRRNYITNVFM